MTNLKKSNANKCFSMLKSFVNDASAKNGEKETALLALDHLRLITAGSDSAIDPTDPTTPTLPGGTNDSLLIGPGTQPFACSGVPRADGNG